MKWNELVALRISELVLKQLISDDRIQLQKPEEDIRKQVERNIKENFEQEKRLLEEVNGMMEDLEKQGHSFERGTMAPLLKARLAKKKGFVL